MDIFNKSGIINVDNVQDIIMANKKDQVRKLHTYTLQPLPKRADVGRPIIKIRTENVRLYVHRQKMSCWISWFPSIYQIRTLTK